MDEKLRINGGKRLTGELVCQGAKNSALPLLAAAVLCEGEVILHRCPPLTDVYAACRILSRLGCHCEIQGTTMVIRNTGITDSEIPDALMREMRSSVIFLGAVLARTGSCLLSLPGGCELGPRPIEMHLAALRRLGAEIQEQGGVIRCQASNLKGTRINLPFPSVGATENVILASVLADGETVLSNAAREPEIEDLARFLNACGAKISGAGGSTVRIRGVRHLHGTEYTVMPDRIAAATYAAAAAVTGGMICLREVCPAHMEGFLSVLEQSGCHIYIEGDRLFLSAMPRLDSVSQITTMPYPGFPTDAQAIAMAMLCKARGVTVFEETIFENRYKHTGDLARMGADIRISGRTAVVQGVPRLYGTQVAATDLRGGAALVVAALAAEGETCIRELHHLDRGYAELEQSLRMLGADVVREVS